VTQVLNLTPCPAEADSPADMASPAGTANVPFGLGAVLPPVATAGEPRMAPSALFARSLAPWAAGATWQRYLDARPKATIPCDLPAQQPSSQPSKQYPHTTRIVAGNGDEKGPHPARDPV
jgi:hypothetical protein